MAVSKVAGGGGADYASLLAQIKAGGAKPPSAEATGGGAGWPADSVTLSAAAQNSAGAGYGSMADAKGVVMKIRLDVAGRDFDPEQSQKEDALIIDYHRDRMEFSGRADAFLRRNFGMPSIKDNGGGLMLTGKIVDAVHKRMAADGDPPPEKSAKLQAIEAQRAAQPQDPASPPEAPPSTATQRTSMIVLSLPGTQGTGSRQVELWVDNDAMDKLAAMKPDDVKRALTDLKAGDEKAEAGNAAVKNGVFGDFMRENASYHPEFTKPEARYALFDPEKGASANPMLMIQTPDMGDYVREHVGDLVDGLMNILQGGKK